MDNFDLKQDYFEHQSYLHGIMHTYRVMYNIKLLTAEHQLPDITYRTAFCAAFIHDMSRRHDGQCASHGSWAVKEKLPVFRDFFKKHGLNDVNLHALKTSVIFHSLPQELPKSHPHYLVTALLKDAMLLTG